MMNKTKYTPTRIILGLAGVMALFGVLLALDLANRGLFWQFAWERTGEEEPIGQMRGLIEWSVGLTRPQPQTAPMAPMTHTNVKPYGVNTFLQLEADPNKVEAQLQMISAAGFAWIRQQFEWAEIEVDGKGQFTDSRNDTDGDGEPNTISAWDKYDRIVDMAEQYGVQIQARLDNPPAWARTQTPGDFSPPDDVADFIDFSVAVAERYQGRIHYYQIWNEPNIYPEWGNQPVNPEAYTELLCRTYTALKAVDPQIVVITGAIAPTIELNAPNSVGGTNLMDMIFLQRMYDAGAADCFDILSVQAYGLFSGPTDERLNPMQVNVARHRYLRDVMVHNGDEHKPIWISEAAWNAAPTYADVPLNPDGSDPITARTAFGQVTLQQQADYAAQLYERAQAEWPWVGVVNYWFFTRPSDREAGQSFYYFRMVEPDYSEDKPTFTPLPVYNALRAHITTTTPTLYRGMHQAAGHWAITTGGLARNSDTANTTFGTALETGFVSFVAHGTDVQMRWQPNAEAQIIVNGAAITLPAADVTWQTLTLANSLTPQTYKISISADDMLVLDTITVQQRTYEKVYPVAAVVGIVLLTVLMAVGGGIWQSRH